jgi:hypothetical protein
MKNAKRDKKTSNAEVGSASTSSIREGCSALTVETVIKGRLRSDTDRPRSESTGRIITNASYQRALACFARTLVRSGASLGKEKRVNKVRFHALFGPSWAIEVEVKFLLGLRPSGQQPDLDNLWKPLQNALAIPPAGLRLKARQGTLLYAMFANDRQLTRYSVQMAPFIAAKPDGDLAIVKVTAHPAPGLDLVRHC